MIKQLYLVFKNYIKMIYTSIHFYIHKNQYYIMYLDKGKVELLIKK
jgi:hypothetical protein